MHVVAVPLWLKATSNKTEKFFNGIVLVLLSNSKACMLLLKSCEQTLICFNLCVIKPLHLDVRKKL